MTNFYNGKRQYAQDVQISQDVQVTLPQNIYCLLDLPSPQCPLRPGSAALRAVQAKGTRLRGLSHQARLGR